MYRVIFASLLLAVLPQAQADKKLTVSNASGDEAFEVAVPDGVKVYEYNANWLDSIPYLTEHARHGEPWAYEALARCHRFGKGGRERSMLNALAYYDLAGINADSLRAEIEKADHDDPLALFCRLMGYLERADKDRIISVVDTLNSAGYHSADILCRYIHAGAEKMTPADVMAYATDPDTDPDAAFLACTAYKLQPDNDDNDDKADNSWAQFLVMDKIPYLYTVFGTEIYEKTVRPESAGGHAGDTTAENHDLRHKAVEFLLKADGQGALSKDGARLLYHYCTTDPMSQWVNMSADDLARIRQLAGIPE